MTVKTNSCEFWSAYGILEKDDIGYYRGDVMKKLTRDFYRRETLIVAQELLGKTLVHDLGTSLIQCTISDVEAYTGVQDKACHAYGGRRTQRTEPLWGEPGFSYIYLIYGMYDLLNVVTEPKGEPCAVLIRGVIPIKPLDEISLMRYQKPYDALTKAQIKNMSNGPGKVCKAMKLGRSHNELDLLGDELYICEAPPIETNKILTGKRINIDYALEAKDFLYRFYLE